MRHEVAVTSLLNERMREGVLSLVARSAYVDGVAPLGEQSLIAIKRGAPTVRHLVVMRDDEIIGYAQLDQATGNAEMVVDPTSRRHGVGTALIVELRKVASHFGATLRQDQEPATNWPKVWAHGDLAPAQALAGRLGMIKVRELWRLVRPLDGIVAEPVAPKGVRLDTFDPERDVAAWLETNRLAFSDHPEQGTWTEEDVRARFSEDWFDPTLFLVLREGPDIVAFNWLKVVGDDGEIYVLGVRPDRQAGGLGRYLLECGLDELNRRGLATASLFVEADNTRAVELYRRVGFEAATADGQYTYPA